MDGIAFPSLALIAATLVGVALHYVSKLAGESEKAGRPINPVTWFLKYPYRTVLMVAGTLGSLIAADAAGQVTLLGAVLLGYAGDSLFNRGTSNKA